MIQQELTIDHQSEYAQRDFHKALEGWRADCVNKVASPKARKAGGRTLLREMNRKNCKVEQEESGNVLTNIFLCKGKTIGELVITFENFNAIEPKKVNS